jgi:hypothetical protein
VMGCLFRGLRDDGNLETTADGLRDLSHRHALFRDRFIAGERGTFLQRQPVEAGGIDAVSRGPAIATLPDIGGDALLEGQR